MVVSSSVVVSTVEESVKPSVVVDVSVAPEVEVTPAVDVLD